MAVDDTTSSENAAEYLRHRRNYASFIRLLTWSSIISVIVGGLVMLIISD